MAKNLVIVESPAKAKTIEGFLGADFMVRSSFGHIRDLSKEKNGVDIARNFMPIYEVSEEKQAVVAELRRASKQADIVWLASDEDREGEAISWHLKEVLELTEAKTRRIVFHEITKPAILHAVANPRRINQDLVDAQQARRVLDRLVGFEISPVLWKKVKPSLSAGRVQSVAVRLIAEREREIDAHRTESSFRITASFFADGKAVLKAELPKKFKTEEEAQAFLESCRNAAFTIKSIEKKPVTKSPEAPFTTSTLQQEASRKLRFSVQKTMSVAQKLYEAGKITYMRTDSVNLSDLALETSKEAILTGWGQRYHHARKYKTKSNLAQEAHEAIRPTYFENQTVDGERDEKALYELIWKRAIASQMSNAELERTTVQIAISTLPNDVLVAQGEVLLFDGFLKVYLAAKEDDDSNDDEQGLLPPLNLGQVLALRLMEATQRFSRPSSRYTEAALVKKLEELGIGRPSTYAPTISTIQKRGYVEKTELESVQRNYVQLSLANSEIKRAIKTETTGADKGKLFPTDIGLLVTDFLKANFKDILDYDFTAKVEKDFDEIAQGREQWQTMLGEFYKPFHANVELTTATSERVTGERILGTDPVSGKPIVTRMGRFGPIAQIGAQDDEVKKFASLRTGQKLETITMEEALELFKLPRTIGDIEGEELQANQGRFGPYIKYKTKFYSLPKGVDPLVVELEEAMEIIRLKDKAEAEKLIKVFEEDAAIQILNGRWGPYLTDGYLNAKLPKDRDPKSMAFDECVELLKDGKPARGAKKPVAKKLTPPKATKTTRAKKADGIGETADAKPTDKKAASPRSTVVRAKAAPKTAAKATSATATRRKPTAAK